MAISSATATSTIPKWTTPRLLKTGLWLTWGASALVLTTSMIGVQSQRQAIKTLGQDAAPSVITALRLKDALAGMDANAANELLFPPGRGAEALKGYEERLDKFAERLVAVAENITYGEAERQPILTIQRMTIEYITKLQQARDFHAAGKRSDAIVAYRSAAEVLDQTLLPAVNDLERTNFNALQQSYREQSETIARQLFLTIISGCLLIGGLVGLQLWLHHHLRRMLNPLLLIATLLAVGGLGDTTLRSLTASNHFENAKSDAFTSIRALRQARALAYGANADESRYLLDPANAARHEQAFFDKVNQIAKIPVGKTFAMVIIESAQGKTVPGFTGSLAEELSNITYKGERESAIANLKALGIYLEIDRQIRQLASSGNYQAAIALCLGKNPGQSDWAFAEFKQANDETFNINLKEFNQAVERSSQELKDFDIKMPVILAAIALLTFLGLQPRLKEYE
jgi:hypothetical protein